MVATEEGVSFRRKDPIIGCIAADQSGIAARPKEPAAVLEAVEEVGADIDGGVVVTVPPETSAVSAVTAADASRRNQTTSVGVAGARRIFFERGTAARARHRGVRLGHGHYLQSEVSLGAQASAQALRR